MAWGRTNKETPPRDNGRGAARLTLDRVVNWLLGNLEDAVALGPSFPLRHFARLLGRKYHTVTIKRFGTVRLRPNSSDAATFVQVFRRKEYDLSAHSQYLRVSAAYQNIVKKGKTPIIIDAGANIGAATIWFAGLFPEAQVFAIEPDAENAELCRLNTRGIPNVTVVEAAIGSSRGAVTLNNPNGQSWAIQTERSNQGEIEIVTIPDVVSRVQGPAQLFVVKVDIEGFEDDLFAENTQWLDEVEVVIIEPHDWLFAGRGTSIAFQRELSRRNFELLISGENLMYFRLAYPYNLTPAEQRGQFSAPENACR
jgi:FkbM family methyltransferase